MGSARAFLPEMKAHYGRLRHYIDGQWSVQEGSDVLPVLNPATGREIAQVPLAGKDEVDAAASAAREAFPHWRETPPAERGRRLLALRGLLIRDAEMLARIIVQDMGKTIDEARGEVARAIENVEVAAGIPSLMMGYGLEDGAAAGIDEEVVVQPIGPFAAITPFNFPVMVAFWFLPYAVAAGNTFIVKPSEQDPVVQDLVFRLIEEAEFPPGVVNLVHGAKDTGEALIDHPDVRGISFVGSTPVARSIYARAAAHGKRVQCGGGAKNFLVVMPDAKLDGAVEAVIRSAYGCAGQRCLAGSAVLALDDIRERFMAKFHRAANDLRLGYGLDEATEMGPVISDAARRRVVDHIARGAEEGARVLLDGRGAEVPDYPGSFVGPTILDDVAPDMKVAREEIFGPVVSVLEAKSIDEAIETVNASRYGNAASIFTQSGAAARAFRYSVRCGNIGINVGVAAPMAYFPFGGQKDSFFGTLHGQGRDAIRFFTDHKVVITRWP